MCVDASAEGTIISANTASMGSIICPTKRAKPLKGGTKGTVLRAQHELVGGQDEGGLKDEDRYHAYGYALRESRAQVGTEAEAHEYEREEAYDSRETADIMLVVDLHSALTMASRGSGFSSSTRRSGV